MAAFRSAGHIYYGPKQQAMQLCCHAAAEINRHTCIMDQSSKQCSYVAMQLQKLTCIYYGPKQKAMQLCCHAVEELSKHAYLYETYEQLSYHAAAESASQSFCS